MKSIFSAAAAWPTRLAGLFAAALLLAAPALAQRGQGHGVLVQSSPGLGGIIAAAHNASFVPLSSDGSVALLQANDGRSDGQLLAELQSDPLTNAVEANAPVTFTPPRLSQSTVSVLNQSTVSVLNNAATTNFYGVTVRSAYANQPALRQIQDIGVSQTGAGDLIAEIDNGVDPQSSILAPVLAPGWNFLDNDADWSCYADQSTVSVLNQSSVSVLNQSTTSVLNQSTVSVLNQSTVSVLNQSTVSVLNQSTVSVLNQSTVSVLNDGSVQSSPGSDNAFLLLFAAHPEFGHGTAVAALAHLVAPQARIMPLKAFDADGQGDLATIVRAIYFAVDHNANVINMSFSSSGTSPDLSRALAYATAHNVVLASSAGNDAANEVVYPGVYPQVLNTASVDANNNLSSFSNYGAGVKLAAPGEALVSVYPGEHYVLVSGTSFSAPLVTGETAALDAVYQSAFTDDYRTADSANGNIPARGVGFGLIQVQSAFGHGVNPAGWLLSQLFNIF